MFKNITISRYVPEWDNQWPAGVNPIFYSGLIEGEADDGTRWILWLDKQGRPEIFWPTRNENGGVVGVGIKLDRPRGRFSGVFEQLGVPDDADADETQPEVVASFPMWEPCEENDKEGLSGMRGMVFAVVPGEGSASERMRKFLTILSEGFGIPGAQKRAAKMREILDSDTPARVVKRLRAALDATDDPDEKTREAILAIVDRDSTQEAVALPLADGGGSQEGGPLG